MITLIMHTTAFSPLRLFSGKFESVSAQNCKGRVRAVENVNLLICCFIYARGGMVVMVAAHTVYVFGPVEGGCGGKRG